MVSVVHQVVFVYQQKISQKTHSQHWHKELHRATVVVLEDRRSTWKWPTAIDLTVPNSKFIMQRGLWETEKMQKISANNNGFSCEKRRVFLNHHSIQCTSLSTIQPLTILDQKLILLWSERTQLHISFEQCSKNCYYIPWNPGWFKREILISWLTK